ncbi:putative 3-oxo-5-alpha-steroid 4-dehydrogenase [Heracleum sosnowskyi]|uniref:3-oxo-5-alpha-steroid 4-dehydrogenase n=1 Tax=Heracleum sosnowskyi TaxID=360622 RepID=A0AAD8IC11_9APIA|nr:putative 3-oxo-5-alpha-steroid 4-dehydrogenase [Heracleum sosnowskyi]
MVLSALLRFVYPPPASLFLTAMSIMSCASLVIAGLMEITGKSMIHYSKMFNTSNTKVEGSKRKMIEFSGRNGMLLAYFPAFVAGVASLTFMQDEGRRFTLVTSAIAVHFFKRLFEVLFIHKYSGSMPIDTVIIISGSYFLYAACVAYSQHLTAGFPEPMIDLKYAGTAMFLVGIIGNFYHHYLLSKLRKEGEKQYKIPHGGLFNLVICPHYLFEILEFIGISCISQTVFPSSFTVGSTSYLIGRSYATRKWYLSKFEDFPKDVKAILPYVF